LPGCLGEDNAVITASSYPPFGKVEEVEGGFNISGTWKTSSGCDHGQWAFLGGLRRDASGQVIDRLSMLVPSCAWVIEDDWHTFGLAGTGSKSLVIKHAFVPHHRAHSLIQYTYSERPANYLYPFNQIFFGAVSALIVGIAQGGIDEYVRQMSVRTNTTDGAGAALSPYVKDRLGNAVVRCVLPVRGCCKCLPRAAPMSSGANWCRSLTACITCSTSPVSVAIAKRR
jgi:3-hydroxy-9,10-secoandrosta-1,3,5(10)-triene-9,17-dione monooxygenase